MLLRAIFSIGVVALFFPPAGETGIRSGGLSSIGPSAVAPDFREALLDHLTAVRADIEAAERARADQGG
jgi:propanediol dehydratase large subunit